MLDIVISNKCKKDLRRAKKRGLDLNDFFAVVEEGYSGEGVGGLGGCVTQG